jgi:hypothetical protein
VACKQSLLDDFSKPETEKPRTGFTEKSIGRSTMSDEVGEEMDTAISCQRTGVLQRKRGDLHRRAKAK